MQQRCYLQPLGATVTERRHHVLKVKWIAEIDDGADVAADDGDYVTRTVHADERGLRHCVKNVNAAAHNQTFQFN